MTSNKNFDKTLISDKEMVLHVFIIWTQFLLISDICFFLKYTHITDEIVIKLQVYPRQWIFRIFPPWFVQLQKTTFRIFVHFQSYWLMLKMNSLNWISSYPTCIYRISNCPSFLVASQKVDRTCPSKVVDALYQDWN